MTQKLDDKFVKNLPYPEKGYRIYFCSDKNPRGFAVRVTAQKANGAPGTKSFILNYTAKGRPRRHTIGQYPTWSVQAARNEAKSLRASVDNGNDPQAQRQTDRDTETMGDLAARFLDEYVKEKKRDSTNVQYKRVCTTYLKSANLQHLPIAEVEYAHIAKAHSTWTKKHGAYAANRAVAVMSKMFSMAKVWGLRSGDNPASGIERNHEEKRERFLNPDEMLRLSEALSAYPTHGLDFMKSELAEVTSRQRTQSANVIRMALLTGARIGEVLASEWSQIDLDAGVWIKPSSHTKQKKVHRAPLSSGALELLKNIQASQPEGERFVFPGKVANSHQKEVKNAWRAIRTLADLENVRIHDLRHTYASQLASAGISLPIIGALLGHTQTATTARYAHLLDDPLRKATEIVSNAVNPSQTAQVTDIKKARA